MDQPVVGRKLENLMMDDSGNLAAQTNGTAVHSPPPQGHQVPACKSLLDTSNRNTTINNLINM